jgi:hypothetical protein
MSYPASVTAVAAALSVPMPAAAQEAEPTAREVLTTQAKPTGAEDDGEKLAKQLSNPVASLISVPFQSNYDMGLGPTGSGAQYKLNIQPVVPVTLSSDWNMISRTILPVIAQDRALPVPPGAGNSQFGLGDIVQSLFFSPQKPTKGGLIWGAGPVFLVPTATDKRLGSQKWGIGPTVVVLKQMGPWTAGALANHIWSFAGGADRDNVSATFLQPFISYTTRKATSFTVNSETTYDWVHHQWTVPVNLTVAQLFPPKVTGLSFPIQIQVGYRHYFDTPSLGPNDGVRLGIVLLFPRK